MLTKHQLAKLRSEITLNSLYISDYENSLNIDARTVCAFFDGFVEYVADDYNGAARDFWDYLNSADNTNNLWEYYNAFDVDPLPIPDDKND